MIVADAGRHFDPAAIEAFCRVSDGRIAEIGAAIR
jgi:response regulator RpfG family c-di-GMP phosphodiesterase